MAKIHPIAQKGFEPDFNSKCKRPDNEAGYYNKELVSFRNICPS